MVKVSLVNHYHMTALNYLRHTIAAVPAAVAGNYGYMSTRLYATICNSDPVFQHIHCYARIRLSKEIVVDLSFGRILGTHFAMIPAAR